MSDTTKMTKDDKSVVPEASCMAVEKDSNSNKDNHQAKDTTCDDQTFPPTKTDPVKSKAHEDNPPTTPPENSAKVSPPGGTSLGDTKTVPADHIKFSDLDFDRDVVIDNIGVTQESGGVYRQVIEKNVAMYRFVRRGEKKKVIDHVVREMQQQGVRFLTYSSPETYTTHVRPERDMNRIRDRVQRCVRDLARKVGQTMSRPMANTPMAPRANGGWDSTASVSGGSTTSTIATSASPSKFFCSPVKIVMPPEGTLDHFVHNGNSSNTLHNGDGDDGNKETPGLVTTTTTITTAVAAAAHQNNNNSSQPSIHQVSVASAKPKPDGPPLPNIEAHIMPIYDKQSEIEMVSPPKLVGGIESWGNMSDTFLKDDDYGCFHDTTIPAEALGGKRSFDTLEPQVNEETEDVIVSPPPLKRPFAADAEYWVRDNGKTNSNESSSSPMWLHMSRQLAHLEQRLQSAEQENAKLRQLLVGGTALHTGQSLPRDCPQHHQEDSTRDGSIDEW